MSLSRYVTLQIRHISVWFGPHGTKAQNKYYMFNLYLYNTSDTIDYSLAVNEIKDFFYDLKSHENLSLLDGTEIGLNIKFNHRLDIRRYKPSLKVPSSFVQWDISVTAGGRLSPVVGTFFNREQRFMRITNLNWCPRVAFASFKDLNEVEWLKENCHIKQANITAYQTQFDDRSTNPPVGHIGPHYDTVYYFCLDLFVDHMNTNHPDKSSGNTNYVKSPILLNDKNNNGSDMTSPESIIIVSVFGSLILIIAFYRVKRQTGQTDENRYVGNGE